MRLIKKPVHVLVAPVLGVMSMVAAPVALAEVSANVAVSNMYLWRGTNLSPDGGAVSGGIDYVNESGFYAGAWMSSETGGHETDLYLGFSGSVNEFGYDVGYIEYLYPEDGAPPANGLGDTDVSEVYLNGSYGPITVGLNFVTDSDYDDDAYYTIAAELGATTITLGMWDLDKGTAGAVNSFSGGDEYSHVTVDYAATDELTFSISVASPDISDAVEEDPLFVVTYAKSFDL